MTTTLSKNVENDFSDLFTASAGLFILSPFPAGISSLQHKRQRESLCLCITCCTILFVNVIPSYMGIPLFMWQNYSITLPHEAPTGFSASADQEQRSPQHTLSVHREGAYYPALSCNRYGARDSPKNPWQSSAAVPQPS